jgi:Holliday junction DNA helicase RuvA
MLTALAMKSSSPLQVCNYEVFLSSASLQQMPSAGEEVFLHIHTSVREDALTLFGFVDMEEKEMFLLLINVSGVGPKLAMTILSGIRPDALSRAISTRDIGRLTSVSGVGKKTAERLCLDLQDKVGFMLTLDEHKHFPRCGLKNCSAKH